MYQDFFNKNDDYLNEFKQKVANQKIASMEERQAEIIRSRNNFLGTFAGITLAGIVGWFVLAPQYAETNKEIPVIRRPQTAIKIKPENPGGMDIPNQDKDVYNIVEKKNIDNTVVENLLPTPEQPKVPDIIAEAPVEENTNNNSLIATNDKETDTNKVTPNKPDDILATATSVSTEKKEEVKQEIAKKAEQVKKVETKKVSEVKKETTKGKWQIQLIVSKNKASVEKTWANLSEKYAELKAMKHEIQTSDLGSQGMFYRLRAGSFASKEEAAKMCASLKAKGLADCITKER